MNVPGRVRRAGTGMKPIVKGLRNDLRYFPSDQDEGADW